jgi:hypothetical protein
MQEIHLDAVPGAMRSGSLVVRFCDLGTNA